MSIKPRDYKREAQTESPERRRHRAERKKARRMVEKQLTAKYGAAQAHKMLMNRDVDHIKPLSQGGKNVASNLRIRSEHENRSDKGTIFVGRKTTRPKHPERQ